jgi:hypothetical protein
MNSFENSSENVDDIHIFKQSYDLDFAWEATARSICNEDRTMYVKWFERYKKRSLALLDKLMFNGDDIALVRDDNGVVVYTGEKGQDENARQCADVMKVNVECLEKLWEMYVG